MSGVDVDDVEDKDNDDSGLGPRPPQVMTRMYVMSCG